MTQMVTQEAVDFRSNRRISDIINGSQLHRFQVALHFELPCHHDDGQPGIDLDCLLNHATPLEETASLTHEDEFESPGFQVADAFGVRITSVNAMPHPLRNTPYVLEMLRIFIYEEDLARRIWFVLLICRWVHGFLPQPVYFDGTPPRLGKFCLSRQIGR